jgi:choline-sulfatase
VDRGPGLPPRDGAAAHLIARAAATAALLLAACGPAPSPPRPDVLLIVCDTLRADRTALLGEASLTPALAALAARGTSFPQAVAPASWTLPSMAALFAGRDATGNRHSAVPDGPALAERFARAGYATIGLSANPLLAADNGFARGFDSFEVAPARGSDELSRDLADLRAWNADALVQRALRAVAALPRGKPVFVWLQLMDAHVPYDPANDERAPVQPGWSAPRPATPHFDAWIEDPTPEQAALLGAWRRAYDGQVAALDASVGRLLEHWPEARRRAPLVAVTADHGEGLFDHARNPDSQPGTGPLAAGYPDHGEQLFEEALRVPLLLAGPGVPAGRREERAVTTRDLGATLLGLCGLPAEGEALPLAAGERAPELLCGAGTRAWYARRGERLLVLPYPERVGAPGVQPLLLAVAAQRLLPQREDLAAREPDTARALETALRDWLQRAGPATEAPLDEATRVRLQQLGYTR